MKPKLAKELLETPLWNKETHQAFQQFGKAYAAIENPRNSLAIAVFLSRLISTGMRRISATAVFEYLYAKTERQPIFWIPHLMTYETARSLISGARVSKVKTEVEPRSCGTGLPLPSSRA